MSKLAGGVRGRVVVIDLVGLTPKLLRGSAPNLQRLAKEGFLAPLGAVFPAVTCPMQSTFVTGKPPSGHGIVGNGWFFRDLAEIWLWRQSNSLVQGDKIFDEGKRRDPDFTAAYLFWWYAMAGPFDIAVTPRPAYPADGRKIADVWTEPPELKQQLNQRLGPFPLFDFWGPRAGIRSSQWIGAAAREVLASRRPTLTFVYLPHLDYDLQRFGPDDPRIDAQVQAVDQVAGEIIEVAREQGCEVVVLSEYGITRVSGAVPINRVLREDGYLRVRDDRVGELLETGLSRAFAVADHQVAHVYVSTPGDVPAVKRLLERTDGIERVLDEEGKRVFGVDHARSGELVAIAARDRWFSYPYWLDERRAPDFARTVDIHRKPGYDPVELFLDPELRFPRLKIATILAKKQLGFRYLMDVISLDTDLVKGSHGRLPDSVEEGPVLLCSAGHAARDEIAAVDVRDLLLELVFGR